jgi:hypothetical protein
MRIWLAGVMLVGALAGCGSSAGSQPLPPAVYGGPVTTEISFDDGDIVLDVPYTTVTGVTWLQAYDNCRPGEAVCDLTRSPQILLASATTLTTGQIEADGSIRPAVKNQLVYVIGWTDVDCPAPAGPAPSSSESVSCQIVNLIDAQTGRVLYAVEGPSSLDSGMIQIMEAGA